MKRNEKIMEILAAYDLTGSYRKAAQPAGCDHHTVRRYVQLRGTGIDPITFDSTSSDAAYGFINNLGTPTHRSRHLTSQQLPAAAYPQLQAENLHGTGDADLIATTPSGTIVDWPAPHPTAPPPPSPTRKPSREQS